MKPLIIAGAITILTTGSPAWATTPSQMGPDYVLTDPDLVFCPMSIGITAPECKKFQPRSALNICELGKKYLEGIFPRVSYIDNLTWQYDTMIDEYTPGYTYKTECYFTIQNQYGSTRYTIKGEVYSLSRNLYPF